MTRLSVAAVPLLITILARGAAAAEIEAAYPNEQDERLQDTLERLCAQADAGDRVTIRLAPGVINEQVSTTIACQKALSWHFAGAGIGKTVLSAEGISSEYNGLRTEGVVFSAIISCGPANPWALPQGGNTCARDIPLVFRPFCEMGASPEDPAALPRLETSCEISDLTMTGASDRRAPTAIGAGWSRLVVKRVALSGFPGGNIGCTNCRADVEHARVGCDPGRGLAVAINTNANWPQGTMPSGSDVRRVDAQGCALGAIVVGQADGAFRDLHATDVSAGMQIIRGRRLTLSHNRIVRASVAGFVVLDTHDSTFAYNHLADNAVGLLFNPASSGNVLEHNLDFDNDVFISGAMDESVVVIPTAPEGW
jgi:hypothetical protein